MPGSTARYDDDTLGREQLALVVNHRTERHVGSLYVDAATHTVGDTFGLLKDFLEHEVWIAPLLYLTQFQVNRLYFLKQFAVEHIHHFEFFALFHHCNAAILKISHLVGVFNDRTGV